MIKASAKEQEEVACGFQTNIDLGGQCSRGRVFQKAFSRCGHEHITVKLQSRFLYI